MAKFENKIYTDAKVELKTPEDWLHMMTHCSGCGKEFESDKQEIKYFDFMFPEDNLLMGFMCKDCCEKTLDFQKTKVHTAYVLRPEWAEDESVAAKADQMLMDYWKKKGQA